MPKYYDSRGRSVATLSELQELARRRQPSLLSWGTTFRDAILGTRKKPYMKIDCAQNGNETTAAPKSEHGSVFNNTPEKSFAPDLLGTKEVAALLNVSQRTVQRLAKQGALPMPVSGSSKRSRWLEADILEFRAG